jgi:DNA-binding XRE family transcriptional regulator
MQDKDTNIYQMARKTTPYTQEYVAPLLNVSVESLKAYESGQRVPPKDIVLNMIKLYGTPWLAAKHLEQDEVAQSYLPKVDMKDLPNAILTFQKELNDVIPLIPKLIDAGYDGKLTPEERAFVKHFCKEGMELAGILIALNLITMEE